MAPRRRPDAADVPETAEAAEEAAMTDPLKPAPKAPAQGPAKRPAKTPAGPGFFDFSHPFYRPLWVRLVVVGTALGWAGFEAVQGHPGWAILFGAVGAVAAWGLLVAYDPAAPETKEEDPK